MSTPDVAEEILYCTVHPDRETTLRCNNCNRPMCVQCAVRTPVGYRCRECVRGVQKAYYTATQTDDLLTFGIAAIAAAIIGYLASTIRISLLFVLILGFPVGGAVGELIIRAVQKRRGRYMPQIAAAGIVIGGLAGVFVWAAARANEILLAVQSRIPPEPVPLDLNVVLRIAFSNIGVLLVIGIIAAAVYGRLRMRG